MHVRKIIQRCQILLSQYGDDWGDTDYILNLLSIVGDDIASKLQNLDLNYDTSVVILPNIAANTTDLSTFQQDGQVLGDMILPLVLEWRLAGQSQEDWQIVDQVSKVIDTDTGTGEEGAPVVSNVDTVESWEWRKGIIYLSPCEQIVDLRLRFQGLAIQLDNDSVQQVAGMTNVHVYRVCQLVALGRGGETVAAAGVFEKLYEQALSDFEDTSVKLGHAKKTRFGGRRGMTGNLNSTGGFTPPIT